MSLNNPQVKDMSEQDEEIFLSFDHLIPGRVLSQQSNEKLGDLFSQWYQDPRFHLHLVKDLYHLPIESEHGFLDSQLTRMKAVMAHV